MQGSSRQPKSYLIPRCSSIFRCHPIVSVGAYLGSLAARSAIMSADASLAPTSWRNLSARYRGAPLCAGAGGWREAPLRRWLGRGPACADQQTAVFLVVARIRRCCAVAPPSPQPRRGPRSPVPNSSARSLLLSPSLTQDGRPASERAGSTAMIVSRLADAAPAHRARSACARLTAAFGIAKMRAR